jgi:hypothetical protein
VTGEQAVQILSAAAFESVEELGKAWHSVAGYDTAELLDADIVSLLHSHQRFAHRCANSAADLLFGPVKARLWEVAMREYL